MAISYTWDVKTCDTYPTKSGKSNVVHTVHWRLTATDDTNWSSLTNSDVQGWVETALGSDKVTSMKAGLDASIAEKVTPTSVQKVLSS